MIVYLVSNNGTLKKENDVLLYSDYKGNVTKLIPEKVSLLIIIGKLQITGSAFQLICRQKIQLFFLSKNGFGNGKFIYGDSKNTLLRHKQHQLYDNSQSALAIAKDIVAGKLSNEFYFSQRIARTRNCQDINSDIRTIRQLHDMVASCDSMDGVRGIEGKAATCYFNCLGHNFIIDWTKFSKRTKNPPLDEINSVLSFLYTLVANRIDILLFQEGLDDSIGYLHALSYGRKSLVFDLEEEFRTPVVDTLACALFNRGEVEQNDFETKEDEGNEENGSNETIENRSLRKGVYLTEGGMKKTIAAFEKKLLQEHYYPELNKKLSYEKILGEQVKLFKSVISGDREHYVPFVVT